MKFLVDAQLPRRLAARLSALGHDALHTLDLPLANRTPDAKITAVADAELRIVIIKDADFVEAYLVSGRPARLLVVSTGNIGNLALLALFEAHLDPNTHAFAEHSYVELTTTNLLLHE